MAIIGKLFKKSTELSFKRNYKKGIKYNSQLRTLYRLIEKAKETNFGIKHRFIQTIENQKIVKDYQKNVPITNYEEFYEKWLYKSINGEKNHTWPGKINFYALSSGTTGSPSKSIPVTKQMIRSFQKTSVSNISSLYKLDLSKNFYNSKLLVIGGSSKLKKIGNTVSSTIPILIHNDLKNNKIQNKSYIALCSFGVGLGFNVMLIKYNGK